MMLGGNQTAFASLTQKETLILSVSVIFVIALGIYPNLLIQLIQNTI